MGAIGKGVEGRLVDLDLLEMDVFSAGAETKSGKDRTPDRRRDGSNNFRRNKMIGVPVEHQGVTTISAL